MWSWVGPVNTPPSSPEDPPTSRWLSTRPPTRSRASSTTTERPPATSSRAAVRPASPAPTTTTSAERLAGCCDLAAPATAGSTVAAVPAAALPISPRRVIPFVCMAPPTSVAS
jgi:hypothetical protein